MNRINKDYDSIIVIGAGRSGTNMLRDIITKIPNCGTWPCDEINYIWRHGNARYPTDEFPLEFATPKVCLFIRDCFNKVAKRYSYEIVVEKTCANSLRVRFVNKVLPDKKFIFLFRNGRDAILSAMKRWTAQLDLPYLLRKARFVPLSDIPYYAFRYLNNRVKKNLSKENRLSSWGPRFEGMDEMVHSKSLLEICAIQWARCIEKSLDDLESIDPARVFKIRYEDFVMNSKEGMLSLAPFLDVRLADDEAESLVKNVSPKSIGKWKLTFEQKDLEILEPIIKRPMQRLGYY